MIDFEIEAKDPEDFELIIDKEGRASYFHPAYVEKVEELLPLIEGLPPSPGRGGRA